MAVANSLHGQYYGTSAGVDGLRHAFDLLEHKKLVTQSMKGPFWHHLDEALHHISEAHFRACWLKLGSVQSLAELTSKSPMQLQALATQILNNLASRNAVTSAANYLWDAIHAGDVGRMEDVLPTLLNSNHTIEVLELIQEMQKEWPESIRNYIKQNYWLVTWMGKPNSWMLFDLAQEENITDIKIVNYQALGPGGSMPYLMKVSPAIPALHISQSYTMNNQARRSRL
ncbi:hypothetical protein BDN71DRAFT_1483751 [Pleurotus eryngii]|uniref:DUF6589 domain-containing protein n=1 Tax=Pleurotus eryngii TaxID=5323 RepID=A0A9P5ZSA5_PLEER|nr:hypothetical protein BDN71DRAFT_1483751 [Pleurotus eryngii]